MIDFNKPLRVVDNPMNVIREPGDSMRLMSIDDNACVIDWNGNIYRLSPMNVLAENMPPEPVKRYQAQFSGGHCSDWWSDKTNPMDITVTAWLVETDHGEDAPERYTYERLSAEGK